MDFCPQILLSFDENAPTLHEFLFIKSIQIICHTWYLHFISLCELIVSRIMQKQGILRVSEAAGVTWAST